MKTLIKRWDGWEWSHAPGATIRNKAKAESLEQADVSTIWTVHLSELTLARGDKLMEYICRAKIVNGIELTTEEKEWIGSIDQRKTS